MCRFKVEKKNSALNYGSFKNLINQPVGQPLFTFQLSVSSKGD
jgi:hypothetical protein